MSQQMDFWPSERCIKSEQKREEVERQLAQALIEIERLRVGLRFYARKYHWQTVGDAALLWDTVSGEPQNWFFRENDTDDAEGIEDGTIAKHVLLGKEINWDDEEPQPLDEESAIYAA